MTSRQSPTRHTSPGLSPAGPTRHTSPGLSPAGRQRLIQRIAARGDLSITCELRPTATRIEHDPLTLGTTTYYGEHPTPVWIVTLRSRKAKPNRGLLEAITGWNDLRVEKEDLDGALSDMEYRSIPPWVRLDERVPEHLDYKRLFAAIDPVPTAPHPDLFTGKLRVRPQSQWRRSAAPDEAATSRVGPDPCG